MAAWLRAGEIEAQKIECNPFDEKKLKSQVPKLVKLSVEKPEVFIPKIQTLCADVGVAVTVVPHLPKTYVNGATRWLTPKKATIQLSKRYRYLDTFWFTFLHELGHILLHGKKDEYEKEADAFADK